jgi:nucleoid DNA-binding protein
MSKSKKKIVRTARLVKDLHQNNSFNSKRMTRNTVDAFFDTIIDYMKQGYAVQVTGFGRFRLAKGVCTKGGANKTDKPKYFYKVAFKASPTLKKQLNIDEEEQG